MTTSARYWFYHKVLKETPAAREAADGKTVPAVVFGPAAAAAGEHEAKWSGRAG